MDERRSKYFVPQGQTKIMNEGWAVLIHEKIMYDLNLPDKYHLAFLKTHNQVVRPIVGRVNPYHLGLSCDNRDLGVAVGPIKFIEKIPEPMVEYSCIKKK